MKIGKKAKQEQLNIFKKWHKKKREFSNTTRPHWKTWHGMWRCAGCDKTTIKGFYVAIKIEILLFFDLNKVTSTKYFMESTWYKSTSRWGRNGTRECRKRVRFPIQKQWVCKWINWCAKFRDSLSSHKVIRKGIRTHCCSGSWQNILFVFFFFGGGGEVINIPTCGRCFVFKVNTYKYSILIWSLSQTGTALWSPPSQAQLHSL